jgi:VWFA-related protein
MRGQVAAGSLIASVLLTFVHGQQPVFRSSVSHIEVDAYVTDARGAFVKDLTKDDFEVFEDGRPQVLNTFSIVDLPIVAPPPRSNIKPLESDVTTNAGSDEGRLWVMLLDGAGSTVNALRKLRVARQFIEEAFGPNDWMAVVHVQGTMKASQALTRSRSLLLDSLERFRTDVTSDAPRANSTLDAYRVVEDLSRRLGAIRGGRKAVLWIDPPLIFIPSTIRQFVIAQAYRDMVRVAQRNNVAIYPIAGGPTLGAPSEGRAAFQSLAEDTGGMPVIGTNNFSRPFADIVRDNSTYYLLGYDPANEHRDGRFHEITVRVKRPGVTVRARRGYLAPTAEAAIREAEAEPRPLDEIREALRNPVPRTGLQISLSAVPFKGAQTAGSVLLAAHVLGEDLSPDHRVDVGYRAIDGEGNTLLDRGTQYTLTSSPRTLTMREGLRFVDRLELPRGRHEIRFAAHLSDGRTGSVVAYVDVPDFTAGRIALSGLTMDSNGPPESTLFAGADAVPGDAAVTTVRRFTPAGTVTVRGVLYADADIAKDVLAVTATVRGEDGATVRNGLKVSVETTRAPGDYPVLVELPLAGLRPGGYVFMLDARVTRGRGATVTRQVPFRVVLQ